MLTLLTHDNLLWIQKRLVDRYIYRAKQLRREFRTGTGRCQDKMNFAHGLECLKPLDAGSNLLFGAKSTLPCKFQRYLESLWDRCAQAGCQR